MEGQYTRLYADAEGVSHFEELAIELLPGFAAPPAEPAHVAAFVPTAQSAWIGGTAAWKGDTPHPVPRRLLFVYLKGTAEIVAGDGDARRFGPGDVLLAEDTWGSGHSSRVIEGEPCLGLVFTVAETGPDPNRIG
ncbi:MAG TPA: hypothetical protein VFC56_09615 [Stellaceae bacterium]|nr:hypothetical protein [Stellaceae bacterium]